MSFRLPAQVLQLLGLLAAIVLMGCGASGSTTASPTKSAPSDDMVGRGDAASQRDVRREFSTLMAASRFIKSRTGLRAPTPARTPNSTDAEASILSDHRAQMTILPSGAQVITMQYGIAGFDGCETPNLRRISIASQPALLSSHSLAESAPDAHGTYSAVIWPATPAKPVGSYGISGAYRPKRVIAMARSLPPVHGPAIPKENDPACP